MIKGPSFKYITNRNHMRLFEGCFSQSHNDFEQERVKILKKMDNLNSL